MKFKYYPITLLSGALFYGSLSLSQNIKVYNFPLNIENSTITYLVVSLVVGLLIYYLNLNFNENNNIFVISLIVLSAYTLPQILFTITFINRIFFLAASDPFRIASATSFALAKPRPICPSPSPTKIRAEMRKDGKIA